jgi:hypothetical protein
VLVVGVGAEVVVDGGEGELGVADDGVVAAGR